MIRTSTKSIQTVTYDEYGKNVHLYQFTLSIQAPNNAKTVELLRDTELKTELRYKLRSDRSEWHWQVDVVAGDGRWVGGGYAGGVEDFVCESVGHVVVFVVDVNGVADGVGCGHACVESEVEDRYSAAGVGESEAHVSSYASHKTMLLNALLQIQLIEKRESGIARTRSRSSAVVCWVRTLVCVCWRRSTRSRRGAGTVLDHAEGGAFECD